MLNENNFNESKEIEIKESSIKKSLHAYYTQQALWSLQKFRELQLIVAEPSKEYLQSQYEFKIEWDKLISDLENSYYTLQLQEGYCQDHDNSSSEVKEITEIKKNISNIKAKILNIKPKIETVLSRLVAHEHSIRQLINYQRENRKLIDLGYVQSDLYELIQKKELEENILFDLKDRHIVVRQESEFNQVKINNLAESKTEDELKQEQALKLHGSNLAKDLIRITAGIKKSVESIAQLDEAIACQQSKADQLINNLISKSTVNNHSSFWEEGRQPLQNNNNNDNDYPSLEGV